MTFAQTGCIFNWKEQGERAADGDVPFPPPDYAVPAFEGKPIYDTLKKPKRFELIKGADHAFPYPSHCERASTLSLAWLARYLRA
jgi:fermentation-respiration switch protein FrsA (DUF1100 family)